MPCPCCRASSSGTSACCSKAWPPHACKAVFLGRCYSTCTSAGLPLSLAHAAAAALWCEFLLPAGLYSLNTKAMPGYLISFPAPAAGVQPQHSAHAAAHTMGRKPQGLGPHPGRFPRDLCPAPILWLLEVAGRLGGQGNGQGGAAAGLAASVWCSGSAGHSLVACQVRFGGCIGLLEQKVQPCRLTLAAQNACCSS